MTNALVKDTGDARGQSEPRPQHLNLVVEDRSAPLNKCVEDALRTYLGTTDGHDVTDLHQLVMSEVERPMLATVMDHVDGNLSRAAKILGMTRSTLRKRLKAHGVERMR
jgi:Fis family transcriptional regulator